MFQKSHCGRLSSIVTVGNTGEPSDRTATLGVTGGGGKTVDGSILAVAGVSHP